MGTKKKRVWNNDYLEVLDIKLDGENPRIKIPENASQAKIHLLLLQYEDVSELAKDIIASGGLMAGEQIIAAKEGKDYVVLEGNRRVCACQLLLSPRLIPAEFKGRFPTTKDASLKQNLRAIPAAIAPDREAAEITITRRHTKIGIKPWLPAAQYRRIQKMLHAGRTLEEISDIFGITKSKLRTLLRQSELMARAQEPRGWNASQREAITDPRLKTNPYTRFFTLKGVRPALGIAFNPDGSITAKDEKKFSKALRYIAKEFLLPERGTNKPRSDTRTDPTDVFERMAAADSSLSELHNAYLAEMGKSPRRKKPAKGRLKPRATKFFENLECHVEDDHLIRLSDEIRRIPYKSYPTASAFLARALMERTLLWCIDQKKMKNAFRAKVKAKYGLKDVIKFCKDNAGGIFTDPTTARRVLNQWTDTHKDYCDLVVHSNCVAANPAVLETLSSHSFHFIQKVLNNEMLLP